MPLGWKMGLFWLFARMRERRKGCLLTQAALRLWEHDWYGLLQVTSADIASAAKPWRSQCQTHSVPVTCRSGGVEEAETTVTLKVMVCFKAQMLHSTACMKLMDLSQCKVLLWGGIFLLFCWFIIHIFLIYTHKSRRCFMHEEMGSYQMDH